MYAYAQQFSPVMQAYAELQLSLFNGLAKRLAFAAEKITSLNLQAARALAEENASALQQLLQARNAQEFAQAAIEQIQPISAKVQAYQQHLNNIVIDAGGQFSDEVAAAAQPGRDDVQARQYDNDDEDAEETVNHDAEQVGEAEPDEHAQAAEHKSRGGKKEVSNDHEGHHEKLHEAHPSSLISAMIDKIE